MRIPLVGCGGGWYRGGTCSTVDLITCEGCCCCGWDLLLLDIAANLAPGCAASHFRKSTVTSLYRSALFDPVKSRSLYGLSFSLFLALLIFLSLSLSRLDLLLKRWPTRYYIPYLRKSYLVIHQTFCFLSFKLFVSSISFFLLILFFFLWSLFTA